MTIDFNKEFLLLISYKKFFIPIIKNKGDIYVVSMISLYVCLQFSNLYLKFISSYSIFLECFILNQ